MTDLEFIQAVRSSLSIAGTLRTLGRAAVGTNYRFVKREVARLGVDTSHWKGGGTDRTRATPAEVLVSNNDRPRFLVRKVVLRERLVPYVCAKCGSDPVWNGQPLVLRLDHINGVRNDDRLENLRFLCPNCDSQTETFCGRNHPRSGKGKTSSSKRPCEDCGEHLTFRRLCRSCATKKRYKSQPQATKIQWPSVAELEAKIRDSSVLAVARNLGVSDNALRKHLRKSAPISK